ncbi:MAG: hypothetical protein ACRDS9_12060 [Pseudonocardiaceae bacterium]
MTENTTCAECTQPGRYNLYDRWFCTDHRGLAERYAPRPTPDNNLVANLVSEYRIADDEAAEKIAAALRAMGVATVQTYDRAPGVTAVTVSIPQGVDADEHQAATTRICGAIVAGLDSELIQPSRP